ncbi:MAG: hypothetical protein IIV89_05060 [Bacteroidaceae bacterium]|jgi:hypothetical protein|nr:hypothetical protein [Bacteroidaceae bacterium]
MKKKITYEIHGQIERNSYFRIGKALVRIDFTGGAINSTGVYPAQYTTDNPLFQRAIENSEAFRCGEIKRGRVDVVTAVTADAAPEGEAPVVEQNVAPEVTNLQQARTFLMAEPYNCQLAQLQNKSAVKGVAQAMGVSFPNWL